VLWRDAAADLTREPSHSAFAVNAP
jgi:hypothetical protein